MDRERRPNVTLCADAFHMVAWATKALDEVRKEIRRTERGIGAPGLIAHLKGCRYAPPKSPEHPSDQRQEGLDRVASVHKTLHRAHLLKEQFRLVFQLRGTRAIQTLDAWCSWARRCRIPASIDLYRRIVRHRDPIVATLTNDGLSNARHEGLNRRVRPIINRTYGFHSANAALGLIMVTLGPSTHGRPHDRALASDASTHIHAGRPSKDLRRAVSSRPTPSAIRNTCATMW
jgi:transposase